MVKKTRGGVFLLHGSNKVESLVLNAHGKFEYISPATAVYRRCFVINQPCFKRTDCRPGTWGDWYTPVFFGDGSMPEKNCRRSNGRLRPGLVFTKAEGAGSEYQTVSKCVDKRKSLKTRFVYFEITFRKAHVWLRVPPTRCAKIHHDTLLKINHNDIIQSVLTRLDHYLLLLDEPLRACV